MSKSTLTTRTGIFNRTIEVPCRLPEALTFKVKTERAGALKATAYLSGLEISAGEFHDADKHDLSDADADRLIVATHNILCVIKAALGITGPVPPGSPLPAIALAYEAECAAFDACVKAHRELPRSITGDAMYWREPSEDSRAALLLSNYIQHVVENACKAHTDRAESKVTP